MSPATDLRYAPAARTGAPPVQPLSDPQVLQTGTDRGTGDQLATRNDERQPVRFEQVNGSRVGGQTRAPASPTSPPVISGERGVPRPTTAAEPARPVAPVPAPATTGSTVEPARGSSAGSEVRVTGPSAVDSSAALEGGVTDDRPSGRPDGTVTRPDRTAAPGQGDTRRGGPAGPSSTGAAGAAPQASDHPAPPSAASPPNIGDRFRDDVRGTLTGLGTRYARDGDRLPPPKTPGWQRPTPDALRAAIDALGPDHRWYGQRYLTISDPGQRKIVIRGLMDPSGGPELLNSLATLVQAKMTIGSEGADHAMLGAAASIVAGKAFTDEMKAGVIPHVRYMSRAARLDWVRRLGWMKAGKEASVVDALRELQKALMGCYDGNGNLISTVG